MAEVTINLVPAREYDALSYGIVLRSETEHRMEGRGIHNRGSRHVLQVWMNRERDGVRQDPLGRPTSEPLSYLWSPQASVITAHPGLRDSTPQGRSLELGDTVVLEIGGKVFGRFTVEAKPLHNPHLVPLAPAEVEA